MIFSGIEYIAILTIAFSISFFSIPLLMRIALKFNLLDRPNENHKSHKVPVPYLGGFSILIPILTLTLFGPLFDNSKGGFISNAAVVVVPSVALSIVGFIDDIFKLEAKRKFFVQVLASCLVALYLNERGFLISLFENSFLNYLVSIVWMVGITNSFNLLDNFDGSTAGVAAISSFSLVLLSLQNGQYLIAAFSMALLGALIGFLPWNFIPAKIFLGDGGALFIGMILSVLLLRFETLDETKITASLIPILLMAVPIIDTSVAFFGRLVRRISPFQGGRDHVSHRLISLGLSRKKTLMTIWGISFFFNCVALILPLVPSSFTVILSTISTIAIGLLIILFLKVTPSDYPGSRE
jgi:UDP-GlcNAc:undecaprenyl-phosphate/decaprenyl-phosphate GlcNAc-1-phosphate transferase